MDFSVSPANEASPPVPQLGNFSLGRHPMLPTEVSFQHSPNSIQGSRHKCCIVCSVLFSVRIHGGKTLLQGTPEKAFHSFGRVGDDFAILDSCEDLNRDHALPPNYPKQTNQFNQISVFQSRLSAKLRLLLSAV